MKEVEIVQAKSRFSQIARLVSQTGEPVRIMNRGKDLVDITPIPARGNGRHTPKHALAKLSRLRRKLPKTSFARIKADIEAGRR